MMLWVPTVRVDVERVATPPIGLEVPSTAEPSMNVTSPPGVPLPEVTVAVNVTDWPAADGLGVEVSTVAVDAAVTT